MTRHQEMGIIGYLLDRGIDSSGGHFIGYHLEKRNFSKKAIKTLYRFAARCRRSPSFRRPIRPHVLPDEVRRSTEWNDTSSECHELDEKLVTKDLDVDIIWKKLDRTEEVVNPALTAYVFEWIAGDGREDDAPRPGSGYLKDQFGIKYIAIGGGDYKMEYRCIKEGDLVGKRWCAAKVKRVTERTDGTVTTTLINPHQHRV